MYAKTSPKINTNSMAGIGLLLFVFLLITTPLIANNEIHKHFPEKDPIDKRQISQKNTLEVIINNKNEIRVNGVHINDLNELKKITTAFIDSGADLDPEGRNTTTLLDHPKTAVIKLLASREANYHVYINAQNAITNAYTDLRNKVTHERYKINFTNLKLSFKKNQNDEKLESYINSTSF
ncbi:biopolymer transporter ExbD [Flavobacteriaceae bacterium F08102]|nr:biopolymer transporter ExbD [Flavobacteriaceae bacterium F08102]